GNGFKQRCAARHAWPRRLLWRDRVDRRGPPLGHSNGRDRPGLLWAYVLGVPSVDRKEWGHRLEAPPGTGETVARRRPWLTELRGRAWRRVRQDQRTLPG